MEVAETHEEANQIANEAFEFTQETSFRNALNADEGKGAPQRAPARQRPRPPISTRRRATSR